MCASMAVNAAPLRIVAIGASNTHGGTLAIKAHIRAIAGPAPIRDSLSHDGPEGSARERQQS